MVEIGQETSVQRDRQADRQTDIYIYINVYFYHIGELTVKFSTSIGTFVHRQILPYFSTHFHNNKFSLSNKKRIFISP